MSRFFINILQYCEHFLWERCGNKILNVNQNQIQNLMGVYFGGYIKQDIISNIPNEIFLKTTKILFDLHYKSFRITKHILEYKNKKKTSQIQDPIEFYGIQNNPGDYQ